MDLRFDTMLYSNLGNKHFVAGHTKCSCGPQVPHPRPIPIGIQGMEELMRCELG